MSRERFGFRKYGPNCRYHLKGSIVVKKSTAEWPKTYSKANDDVVDWLCQCAHRWNSDVIIEYPAEKNLPPRDCYYARKIVPTSYPATSIRLVKVSLEPCEATNDLSGHSCSREGVGRSNDASLPAILSTPHATASSRSARRAVSVCICTVRSRCSAPAFSDSSVA